MGISQTGPYPGLLSVFSRARRREACGMTGVAVEAQAALAVNLCKTYGAGHATVRALDNVTVASRENITLPIALAGRKPDQAWVDSLTRQLGIADRLTHRPGEPSGGQQQRVACARALVNKPDLVFADEPTGNLDSNAAADLLAFLRRSVRELGQSVVMVTHDPRSAAYADRVIFLADGAVVSELREPTADSVLERMRTLGE
jgi:predicted ABC-type transport system involved in lysophospholipase L1 biosynthesis ATPase subunit